jgi:hypothetical protein
VAALLVNNMGLHWKRENVWWGRGSNRGHLLGLLASSKTSSPIDFRDQIGIYVLYDTFKVIYIGQAGNGNAVLFDRLKMHTRDHLADRWDRFSWFGIQRVNKGGTLHAINNLKTQICDALNHLEGILIATVEPPNNKQGAKFGPRVKYYKQYRDIDNLGPSDAEMLRKISKHLKVG